MTNDQIQREAALYDLDLLQASFIM